MKWQRTVMITVLCLGLFCSFSTLNNQAMAQGKAAPAAQKITVLNPMGTPPPIQRKAQAPRLDTLDGKTIYLVNTGFVGTERLMEVMTEWFATNYPKTTIVNKRNPSMDQPNKALWAEINEKADGVIIGLGH
jgi:hypothetical protein